MNIKLPPSGEIRGRVFDAYSTLFDVDSAARLTRGILRNKWQDVAELWRTKQLQYTWLRSLAGRHANFWQVTGDALDFALDSLKLANPKVREELMDLYLRLSACPEVKNVLAQLKARGFKCAILSNGSSNIGNRKCRYSKLGFVHTCGGYIPLQIHGRSRMQIPQPSLTQRTPAIINCCLRNRTKQKTSDP
jgi:2-haloalkanoic acid dehalogenase type II